MCRLGRYFYIVIFFSSVLCIASAHAFPVWLALIKVLCVQPARLSCALKVRCFS